MRQLKMIKYTKMINEAVKELVCVYYLTDVLQVFDIMSFCAHDFIDDIGPHLVPVLGGLAQTQTIGTGVRTGLSVAILHLAGAFGSLDRCVFLLIYP